MASISSLLSNENGFNSNKKGSENGRSGSTSHNYAMLLDSGNSEKSHCTENYNNSRYDIFCAHPCLTLSKLGENDNLEINRLNQDLDSLKINPLEQDPFKQMREILRKVKQLIKNNSLVNNIDKDLPFQGGWLGYFSYDFGKSLELREQEKSTEMDIPLCNFGLYRWSIITDHKMKTTNLYNFCLSNEKWKNIQSFFKNEHKIESNIKNRFKLKKPFKSNVNFERYQSSFKTIQENIITGNCYQINYAHQFTAPFIGNTLEAYQQLTKVNQSPFSAYLNFGNFQILSLSPERFISIKNGRVLTQPIKGTAPRNKDIKIDKQNSKNLLSSEKDRAENLMIVDLLRNDLSKTAEIDSVKVPELFGLYTFESVHHLISTVTSQIAPHYDVFDVLESCLPGGSITGAPKISAMKIIDQLEKFKRGIYCGVIGYMDFNGNMDTNICIRTLLAKNNQLFCYAGGGIVFDSTAESEYQETFHKVSKIIPVLEEQFLSQNSHNITNEALVENQHG